MPAREKNLRLHWPLSLFIGDGHSNSRALLSRLAIDPPYLWETWHGCKRSANVVYERAGYRVSKSVYVESLQ